MALYPQPDTDCRGMRRGAGRETLGPGEASQADCRRRATGDQLDGDLDLSLGAYPRRLSPAPGRSRLRSLDCHESNVGLGSKRAGTITRPERSTGAQQPRRGGRVGPFWTSGLADAVANARFGHEQRAGAGVRRGLDQLPSEAADVDVEVVPFLGIGLAPDRPKQAPPSEEPARA